MTDRVLGLKEAYRVSKAEGQLGPSEHQRSPNRMPRQVFNRLPLAKRLSGANIDRRTDVKA
jgi:ubiquinone/menaquinone biosynthesis C-methylase UbiE